MITPRGGHNSLIKVEQVRASVGVRRTSNQSPEVSIQDQFTPRLEKTVNTATMRPTIQYSVSSQKNYSVNSEIARQFSRQFNRMYSKEKMDLDKYHMSMVR